MVIDLFAGGGGASTGLEAALGRAVDVAINHSATALAVHKANHPDTLHLTADIWEVRPQDVTKGRPVDVLWASPDCTHFSVAKGGKPRAKNIRSLAEVVVEWAQAVRPRCIFVENVREFQGWGPLDNEGHPIEERKGELFERWCVRLRLLGYSVEWRVLDASLFGAPTRRMRLFIVARCDGEAIRWPVPTHGTKNRPLRAAAECIDWSLPCPSIFERARPLAEKTLWRIAQGIKRFVIENPEPFLVGCGGRAGQTPPTPVSAPVGTITAKADRCVVTPHIIKVNHGGHTDRAESITEPLSTVTAQRRGHALVATSLMTIDHGSSQHAVQALTEPLATVTAKARHACVAAFMSKHYGGVVGVPLDGRPMDTITATDHHAIAAATLIKIQGDSHGVPIFEPMPTVVSSGLHVAEVRAFLLAYYGSGSVGQSLHQPLRTITALDRLGLVTVGGVEHQIVDIGMRMLEPHELLRAQFGEFAAKYDLSAATSKAAKVRLIGNSVCPEVARAVVRANLGGGEARAAA
jgi:DNA (cytosine-5)-methyltransferase 1